MILLTKMNKSKSRGQSEKDVELKYKSNENNKLVY